MKIHSLSCSGVESYLWNVYIKPQNNFGASQKTEEYILENSTLYYLPQKNLKVKRFNSITPSFQLQPYYLQTKLGISTSILCT